MFKLRYWLLSIMRIELIVFLALFIGLISMTVSVLAFTAIRSLLGCMLIHYWDFAIKLSLFTIGLIVLFILLFINLYRIITNFIKKDLSSKGYD